MLVIKVWGLPPTSELALREIHKHIVDTVTLIQDLGIESEKDMCVFFPTDMMKYGLGTEIIIDIQGIPSLPENPANMLSHHLKKVLGKFYPDALIEVHWNLVEVFRS